MKKMVFAENILPAAAPPLLPLFRRGHQPAATIDVRVRVNPVPADARPVRRTSTSPPPPSHISEADYA